MTANKYKIRVNKVEQDLRIPLQLTFEETGRGDLITKYEDDVLRKLINPTKDFEVTRYNHMGFNCGGMSYLNDVPIANAKINYDFQFYSGLGVWSDKYSAKGWTNLEIFKKANSLRNSFFKLDLYDTPYRRNQKLYISLILTPFSGQDDILTVLYPDGSSSLEYIKVPEFIFGAKTKDVKENFWIYWLKEKVKDLDIFTFYMSAKFFDAKTGEVNKFTTHPQLYLTATNGSWVYNLPEELFYYQVDLDHDTKSYKITQLLSSEVTVPSRVGLVGAAADDCGSPPQQPVDWFEYVNPA